MVSPLRREERGRRCTSYYNADYYGGVHRPVGELHQQPLAGALSACSALMLYLDGRLSIGNLSSFVLYSRRVLRPHQRGRPTSSRELQSALAAAERVFSLLDEPSRSPPTCPARPSCA